MGGEMGIRALHQPETVAYDHWGPGAFVADADVGWRHAPKYRGRTVKPGGFRADVATDARGFRVPWAQTPGEPELAGGSRVLVLGGTAAFGMGVREEDSFVGRLRARLGQDGLAVENAAQRRARRAA